MTIATPSSSVEPSAASCQTPQGSNQLAGSLAECTSLRSTYVAGLAYVAEKFNSPYAALTLDVDNGSIEDDVAANEAARESWRRHCDGMMLASRYHQTGRARFFRADGINRTLAVISVPLGNQPDGAIGAMAAVVPCDRRDAATAQLNELSTIAAVIDLQAVAARRPPRPPAAVSPLTTIAAHKNLDEFCFALTNSLKSSSNCDQAALGLVRGTGVKLACVSGFDDLYPRSPGSRIIQQAMCECLDAGEIICYQSESESERGTRRLTSGHHLHKQWYASLGALPVASIPLMLEGQCAAIVSVRNPGGRPFKREQLCKIRELVAPMLPGLLLLERADRSAFQRALESVRRLTSGSSEPGRVRRKVLAALTILMVAWVLFGKIEYRLSAPCVVESTDDMQLSAPFEGAIAEVHVRPGDRVAAGQTLARMDTRSLESERAKLFAELREAEVSTIQASQGGYLSAAAQSHAATRTAKARIKAIDEKLQSAVVRAPGPGVILEGQLEPRTGEVVALGEPLARFAPEDHWRITVHVPDRSAAEIEIGQLAVAAISARPEESHSLTIVQLHAASSVEDGRNVFAAEAEFDGVPPKWFRAGMRGTARVDIGRRPVWWVWAHRLLDSVRMQLWRL